MNTIAQLFSPNDVLSNVEIPDKQALFAAVGRLWQESRGMRASEVVENLNAREMLGSTGLGHGVAIPHARVKGLSEAVAAFVRPATPIAFDSPDGQPVAYFFVLLVPEAATEQHLQILADVVGMLSDEQFRTQLASAKSPQDIYQVFSSWTDQN
ncbi:MAG TPA: PTS sugar transporter subunit IIA [Burkholderiaceae bacterium]|jgi:PTS system nitrogen regulatory IIA component|nr:PTS sugar transporter subunit IIA [Burkholderiaceae bacterium]